MHVPHPALRTAIVAASALALLALPDRVRAADEDHVDVTGLLQVWGIAFDQDEDPQADPAGVGDPEHDPGVTLHRARIGLDARQGPLDWNLTVGIAEPYDALQIASEDFGIVDAYAGGTWGLGAGAFRLSAGVQKVPFMREPQMSARDLVFQERSVVTQYLSPTREVGVLAAYDVSLLKVSLGAYNGNGRIFGDDNVGKQLVGRVELGQGDDYRTWSAKGENAFGAGLSALQDTDVSSSTMSLGVDGMVRVKRFTILADFVREQEKPRNTDVAPPEVLDPVVRMGAHANLSYWLPLGDGQAEGVELAARAAWLDNATWIDDNGDVLLVNAGATWRDVRPGFDLGAGYVRRQELAGRSLANDTVRLWMQVQPRVRISGPPSTAAGTALEPWASGFLGTWTASGEFDGAELQLWEQPGLGLVGSFKMTKPRGKVVVGRPYPLDNFNYSDHTLRLRLDPYGENRDIVWFELTPSANGQLCGYGYEDGRRQDVVNGTGGGQWICWTRSS
jgi:hypothetical protein